MISRVKVFVCLFLTNCKFWQGKFRLHIMAFVQDILLKVHLSFTLQTLMNVSKVDEYTMSRVAKIYSIICI